MNILGLLDIRSLRGYDLACAFRGPDYPDTRMLKKALTSRIRHLLGVTIAPTRAARLTLTEAGMALTEATGRANELRHYLNHVRLAAETLGEGDLATLASRLARGMPVTPEEFVDLAGGEDMTFKGM